MSFNVFISSSIITCLVFILTNFYMIKIDFRTKPVYSFNFAKTCMTSEPPLSFVVSIIAPTPLENNTLFPINLLYNTCTLNSYTHLMFISKFINPSIWPIYMLIEVLLCKSTQICINDKIKRSSSEIANGEIAI